MDKPLIHLLGYLTDDQWKDAIQAFNGFDKDSIKAYMKEVEEVYNCAFEKARNTK